MVCVCVRVLYTPDTTSLLLHQHDLLRFTCSLPPDCVRAVTRTHRRNVIRSAFLISPFRHAHALPHSCSHSVSHAHCEWLQFRHLTLWVELCGCKRLSVCGSDRPVSSSSTVEWEPCNWITALHWGETHGWGGGVVVCVLRECFSGAIRENGVNDWERRSRRREEKEQRAVLRGWWRAAECQRISALCLPRWSETLTFILECVWQEKRKKKKKRNCCPRTRIRGRIRFIQQPHDTNVSMQADEKCCAGWIRWSNLFVCFQIASHVHIPSTLHCTENDASHFRLQTAN